MFPSTAEQQRNATWGNKVVSISVSYKYWFYWARVTLISSVCYKVWQDQSKETPHQSRPVYTMTEGWKEKHRDIIFLNITWFNKNINKALNLNVYLPDDPEYNANKNIHINAYWQFTQFSHSRARAILLNTDNFCCVLILMYQNSNFILKKYIIV